MKASYKFLFILSFLVLFTKCGCDDDDASGERVPTLNAAIFETCKETINFVGSDIYGYPETSPLFGDHWKLGGHPASALEELPDLGLNLILPEIEAGFYDITNDNASGKIVVYYIDEDGNQYDSTNNNSTAFVEITEDDLKKIVVTFDNVEVYNAVLEQTKCINKFEYVFYFSL